MGAKGSVEAAKTNAQNWGMLEHKHGKPGSGHHHHQRSQSLNRGVRGVSGAGGTQWSSTRGATGEFGDMW
uniref:Uncharacterized protein LOC114337852 n=1 Tax=Diabrotica virgifera virgifera TaxID=50390 RepID=A0A6P7GBW0_DIAVI